MDEDQQLAFSVPDIEVSEEDIKRIEENGQLMTPEEYLLMGRYEVSKLPPVTKAELPVSFDRSSSDDENDDVDENADDYQPSEEWITCLLSKFSDIRIDILYWSENIYLLNNLPYLPHVNDLEQWNLFIFGNNNYSGNYPKLSILIQFDQLLTSKLLSHLINKLDNDIKLLNRHFALWLFGILALVDKPVVPDNSALINNLLRKCKKERENVVDYNSEELGYLNILIVICEIYFVQSSEALNYTDYIK